MVLRNFWYTRHVLPLWGINFEPYRAIKMPTPVGWVFLLPDTIRTCDLQSRSFQAHPDKMLCFQWLYGFYRQHLFFLNFLKTIENTG